MSDYTFERELLRVLNPIGDQLSTYRLQLPHIRYSADTPIWNIALARLPEPLSCTSGSL